MSQTPIYDQLRGERINADVPAAEAEPRQVEHPEPRRLPVGASAAVFSRSALRRVSFGPAREQGRQSVPDVTQADQVRAW